MGVQSNSPIPPRNSKPGLLADLYKAPPGWTGLQISAEFSVVLTLVFGARETVIGRHARAEWPPAI